MVFIRFSKSLFTKVLYWCALHCSLPKIFTFRVVVFGIAHTSSKSLITSHLPLSLSSSPLSPSRLKHKLEFNDEKTVMVAKDANIQNEDTFDMYDPRNPINKRRREDGVTDPRGQSERQKAKRTKR